MKAFNDLAKLKEEAESAGDQEFKNLAEFLRSWIYYDRGDLERGQECQKDLYDSLSSSAGAFSKIQFNFYLGLIELERGQISAAKSRLDEMKPLIPEKMSALSAWTFAPAYVNILEGEIALEQGDFQKAIDIFEKEKPQQNAVFRHWVFSPGMPPLFPFLRDVLARAYQNNGEIDKAIAEYERLVTYDPTNIERPLIHPRYHYRLAKLYEQKGFRTKAVKRYHRFLDIWKDADPGIPEVEDARKRLTDLNGS